MRPDSTPPRAGPSAEIEVDLETAAAIGFAAVVSLRGDQDVSLGTALRRTLEALDGHLLIDLSGCTFIDASIVAILLQKSRRLGQVGSRLEFVVPPENASLARRFELFSIGALMPVHERMPAASSSVRRLR
jgi:anti-anti-sigma regulatory factor